MVENPHADMVVLEGYAYRTTDSNTSGSVTAKLKGHLMLRSILTLCLLTVPAAFAQSANQEARFFDAMRAMATQTYTFYVSVDPRFAALLTPVGLDPSFRENQRCFLTRLADDGGSNILEEYIAAMEAQSKTEITSLIDLGNDLPEVMTSDLVFAASSECGAMSYTTRQMATPEFTNLMNDPVVMRGLMGE